MKKRNVRVAADLRAAEWRQVMKRLTLVLLIMVAILGAGVGARPILGRGAADPIPNATAVVTVKDFDFFTTANNPVGVAVDHRGDVKVGILGLPIFGPRSSTPIYTVTPEGETRDFATMPLSADTSACRAARPGRDFVSPGVQQEPTPFMTGIVYHRSGDLYVGLPNCDPSTHGIWRVSTDGTAQPFATVPLSQLPKGLAFTNGGFPLYVTDLHDFTRSRQECKTAEGTANACSLKIWRIDQSGAVSVWKESTLFYGSPDSPLLHPHGVNGIVVDNSGQNVYVTVTDYGRIIRIPINSNGSAGSPQVVFENINYWGMDGITMGPDGNLYVVIVRTDQLVALHPDGTGFKVVLQGHPLDGPTQLTFGKGNAGPGSANLPPLYITNGSGARIFFFNLAAFVFGQGNLLTGINQLVNFGIKTPYEVIDLQPRPSLVRVLLKAQ
jgi:sugar lactone lactonase YvrE